MRSFVIATAAFMAAGCVTGRHIEDHVGLHFHADLGPGWTASRASDAGVSREFNGVGGIAAVSLGGAIVPNLILGGEVWGAGAIDPEYSEDGLAETLDGMSYDVTAYGARLTYYLMPANLYFSATPSITRLSLYDPFGDTVDYSRWGLGLRAAIGKEWFVSPRWGLGLAGVLHLSSNDGGPDGPRWRTWGGGLALSASFN